MERVGKTHCEYSCNYKSNAKRNKEICQPYWPHKRLTTHHEVRRSDRMAPFRKHKDSMGNLYSLPPREHERTERMIDHKISGVRRLPIFSRREEVAAKVPWNEPYTIYSVDNEIKPVSSVKERAYPRRVIKTIFERNNQVVNIPLYKPGLAPQPSL